MADRPVAFVTGASRGIGAAMILEFAGRGYDVALVARTQADLDAVAAQAGESGADAIVLTGDIADLDFCENAIQQTIERFGRIDALVNNAAWRELVTMRKITVESWEKTLRISLTAPAFLAKWAAVHMEKQGSGVIINISSVMSDRASGFSPAYIACKGALDSLTFDLAALYGAVGIRVVCVNPGAIATEMSSDYESDVGDSISDEIVDALTGFTPLGRFGKPEEIAKTVVWLCSDDASFITGTTILADGGIGHQLHPRKVQALMYPDEFK